MKHLLKRALVLDAVAVPIMLVYWWLTGPRTAVHLSNGLVIGEGILIMIGFLFYGDNRAASGDFTWQYARSASAMGLAARHRQDWADRAKSYLATVLFLIAGVMSSVRGIIVHLMGE